MALPEEDRKSSSEGRKRRKQRKRETGGQGISTRALWCAIGARSAGGLCVLLQGESAQLWRRERGVNPTFSRQRVPASTAAGCRASQSSAVDVAGKGQSSGTAGSWQAAVRSRDRGGGWNRGVGEQNHGQGPCSGSEGWARRNGKSRRGRTGTRVQGQQGSQGDIKQSEGETQELAADCFFYPIAPPMVCLPQKDYWIVWRIFSLQQELPRL